MPSPLRRLSPGVVLGVWLLVGPALAQDLHAVPVPPSHPLLGTWRVTLPGPPCVEEHTLHADGTRSSLSALERNDAVFELSAQPSPQGYYRWVDRVERGNGQPDCGGGVAAVGQVMVHFARLLDDGKRFLLCSDQRLESCFATFHRVGFDT